jgi:transcription initiation factor TFIIH subunit 2
VIFSGNPQLQAQSLRDYRGGGGHIALQRALDIALALMKPVPAYGSREILFVTGSLSTADGAELLKTGEELKKERVRTSVVSLSAEVYAFKMLAHMTGGTFAVATDKEHFNKLIQAQLEPVPVELERAATARRTWIRMGFPRASSETLSYCSCHPKALVTAGYLCPRCDAKYCELPTDCRVCSTTLASAPLLARTYHHLFPVPVYPEVEVMGDRASAPDVQCFSCSTMVQLQDALVSQCPRCERHFCFECDMFIHTKLYNCPGCLCGNISGTSLTNLAARALK